MLSGNDEFETSVYLHHFRSKGFVLESVDESLQRKAKEQNKLILLSLGYSGNQACTQFREKALSDPQVLRLLKEKFLFSAVDAQIRPDLAHVFQNAARLLEQAGGYPLNLFLTPDLDIFFATGALPARAQKGRPGFLELLEQMQMMWDKEPAALIKQGQELKYGLEQMESLKPSTSLSSHSFRRAHRQLRELFDQGHGGFGSGPKFPLPATLDFLLQHGTHGENDATAMALSTLDEMAKGAIYDQVGGGFFRSTRDAAWQQPVFEKNVGENAALVLSYLSAYQLTGHPAYRRIIRETLHFAQHELQNTAGAYFSGTINKEDSKQSGAIAGQHFFFNKRELDKILGKKDAQIASLFYEIGQELQDEERALPTARGTLKSVAQQLGQPEALVAEVMTTVREALKHAREKRDGQELNDLIIASENALLLSAFCKAAVVLEDEDFRKRARRLKEIFLSTWLTSEHQVPHLYLPERESSQSTSYLLDGALWGHALLDYAEAFGDIELLPQINLLFERLRVDFQDPESLTFHERNLAGDQLGLIQAWKIAGGSSSGNASAIYLGMRMARHQASGSLFKEMTGILQDSAELLRRAPHAHPLLLSTLQHRLSPTVQIRAAQHSTSEEDLDSQDSQATIAQEELRELEFKIRSHYLPTAFWALNPNTNPEADSSLTQLTLLAPDNAQTSELEPSLYANFNRYTLKSSQAWTELLPPLLKAIKQGCLNEKGAYLLPGSAEAAATQSRLNRFSQSGQLGPLSISRLAAGTHRMGLDIKEHEQALKAAIEGGINLIDTSPTFAFGDAERLVGRVLSELHRENSDLRAALVIMTKVGVVVGAEAEELASHDAFEGDLSWTVPLKQTEKGKGTEKHRSQLTQGAFSLDPRVLRRQIETSRQRLGLETIDGVLLQSPEHLLNHGHSQDDLQKALTEALVTLSSLKQEGKIQFSGIFFFFLVRRGRAPAGDELSLDTIIAAKTAAGIDPNEPFCISLAINLSEKDALAPASYERKRAALAEEIHAAGMQLVATRPLSAVTPEALFRLKDPGKSPDGAAATDLNSARYRVASLEAEFDTTFAAALRLAGLVGQGPVLQFSTQLGPKLEKSASLEQFNLGETTLVSPRLRQILGGLDQAHQGPEKAKYLKFKERYIHALAAYLAAIREVAREKNRLFLRQLLPDISTEDTKDIAYDPIVRQALKEVSEHPLVSSTLVGLRNAKYVDEVLTILTGEERKPA